MILHPFTHLTTISHAGAPRAAPVLPSPALVGPETVQNMLPVLTSRLLAHRSPTNMPERPPLCAALRKYRVSTRG